MDWVASIHQAIQYIEEHLREELTIREIAQQAALSPFYFQKGFAMLCGMTVGDYIRQRRLSAAGLEVLTTDRKIIDIALEFGYDSPDSFTKAFARFHGLTPAALRKSGGAVRSFAPLRIKVELLTKWPQKISNGNLSRKKDAHWRHFVFHIIRFRFKAVAERRQ